MNYTHCFLAKSCFCFNQWPDIYFRRFNLREYISNFITLLSVYLKKKVKRKGCVYASRYFCSPPYLNFVARNQIRKYATGAGRWSWQHIQLHPTALIGRHSDFLVCHVNSSSFPFICIHIAAQFLAFARRVSARYSNFRLSIGNCFAERHVDN